MTERVPLGCDEAQLLMSDLIDGLLDPARTASVDAHCGGCEACGEFLEALRRTVESCRKQPRPRIGEDCLARAVEKAREELARRGLLKPV